MTLFMFRFWSEFSTLSSKLPSNLKGLIIGTIMFEKTFPFTQKQKKTGINTAEKPQFLLNF